MSSLEETLNTVARLYEQTGVIMNWFPFQLDGEVRWRIYTTNTRTWAVDNPMDEAEGGKRSFPHYATLEEAIRITLVRVVENMKQEKL